MACVLHKSAVHRAQYELDNIVGTAHRLPEFDDAPNLPYVNAFIMEVLRCRTSFPLGLPRRVTQTDYYQGYQIPAGATVLSNNWTMNLDEEIFANPHEFQPERWLHNPDLPVNIFGFGRRSCPGQIMGRNSLFIVVSRLLWAYQFSHASQTNGKDYGIDSTKKVQSILSGPVAFEASFRVRSPERQKVIQDALEAGDYDPESIIERVHNINSA